METKTKVIFRTWIRGGDTIAIFPEIPDGEWTCQSYQLIGQHGTCCIGLTCPATRPATQREIDPLLAELRAIGYENLVIVKRFTRKMELTRRAAL